MGFRCRKWELNTRLTAHLNDVQAAEAIREVKVHHKNAACTIQQTHWDNMLALECEAKVTEEWGHQTFTEAFGVAV